MTREEAKRFLVKHCNPRYPDSDKTQWDEAINLAISALEQSVDVPTDTISRQAAIEAVRRLVIAGWGTDHGVMDSDVIYEALEELPSAQRKGKWIATQEWGGRNYSCSCCHFSFMVDTCMREPMWNYCPNCGAEMKGEEDGNNNQI